MTGSGKTGLCLSLLEEALIDGIPAIAIDPKGDLGNLLLAFPDLKPEDFRPWVDAAEATRQGMTVDQFAASEARKWRKGLADWGQDESRIARYRNAADLAIYTPGSTAGLPLTVLRSFGAPPPAVLADADACRAQVGAAASGLLALLGIQGDPLRSREHILLASLLEHAWRQGRSLQIADLIREIQSPPFDKIGILDLETVFPADDRFGLAMSVNNLLASPGFAGWLEGEPLNVARLLFSEQGKPRLSILSIAHLSESERMFFVTILLNEVVAWMRTQAGTSSLRALLYMDEVFGYFPPTANPPSKTPMLTLLKQARAFGLGVVLATQNPVDLDYKGLSNAGTWFLGRLQTERDKARVLEGLEGASAAAGRQFDRRAMEATLAGLGRRVFLMNNVHDDLPVLFQTRWVLSYLRGPLTREQIRVLTAARGDAPASAKVAAAGPALVPAEGPQHVADLDQAADVERETQVDRPILPPEINEYFLPARAVPSGTRLLYRPALLGTARLHYVHTKTKTDLWRPVALQAAIRDDHSTDVWLEAVQLEEGAPDLDTQPVPDGSFGTLPSILTRPDSYKSWAKSLKDHLYQRVMLTLWYCRALKVYSEPKEAESDFRIRLRQRAREERDLQVEKLRKRYAPKLQTLADQIRRAEERVQREQSQYRQQQMQTAISFGQSILGALFGRKLASTTNVSRAATSMRGVGRSLQQRDDVSRAEESVESLREKTANLEAEFQEEVARIEETVSADQFELEEVPVRPRKSDITLGTVGLLWTPWQVDPDGIAEPAYSKG
jgi:hypothetical protein